MSRKSNDIFIMPFGKYKGLSLGEIYLENPKYLEWVLKEFDESNDIYQEVENFMEEMSGASEVGRDLRF